MAEDGRYRIESAQIDDGQLAIRWGDGHRSRYHPLWLRHQCRCSFCGTPVNAVRGLRLLEIPADVEARRIAFDCDELRVEWSPDDHPSSYAAKWLRDNCYSAEERAQRKHRPRLWDGSIAADAPRFDMSEAERDPAVRLAMLEAVHDYGFCRVDSVPTAEGQSQRLIELVGSQRQTHYGTYTLSNKSAVDNVGDLTGELPPHVDETYRLSSIGITVFQVLRPSSNGGASTLVDGFEACRRLRERWPRDFDLLAATPITTERYDPGANSGGQSRWFVARMPIIRVDADGDLSGIHLNERQIGPLDMPAEKIEPFYRATRRLLAIVYDPQMMITLPLPAGEGLLFDNQRVLHGRTAYTPEDPPRSVLTSSVDLEEFHSSMRMLRLELGIEQSRVRYNQGMVV